MTDNAELRMQITSALGCAVRLVKCEVDGIPGAMLTLDMEQPGDGRHAEVFLGERDLTALEIALRDLSMPQDRVNTGVDW